MRGFRALGGAALLLGLAGCAEVQEQWAFRYGPTPNPDPQAIALTVDRELQVVQALVRGFGYPVIDGVQQYPQSREEWYGVILMGFNTVDDACTSYITNLWKMDRQRGRVTEVLSTTGAATAAIIGVGVSPSAATLTILAQAFGLASALVNTIADSYLYTQSPATILKLVKKSTDAYRDDMANNFFNNKYPVSHPAAVYFHVRGYLALCLPPTIQAQIDDYLAKAKAAPEGSPTAQKAEAGKVAEPKAKASTNIQLH